MAKTHAKCKTWVPFMFRLHPARAAILKGAAEALGMDYSSILNWIVAEACPVLEKIRDGKPVLLPLFNEDSAPRKETG